MKLRSNMLITHYKSGLLFNVVDLVCLVRFLHGLPLLELLFNSKQHHFLDTSLTKMAPRGCIITALALNKAE